MLQVTRHQVYPFVQLLQASSLPSQMLKLSCRLPSDAFAAVSVTPVQNASTNCKKADDLELQREIRLASVRPYWDLTHLRSARTLGQVLQRSNSSRVVVRMFSGEFEQFYELTDTAEGSLGHGGSSVHVKRSLLRCLAVDSLLVAVCKQFQYMYVQVRR